MTEVIFPLRRIVSHRSGPSGVALLTLECGHTVKWYGYYDKKGYVTAKPQQQKRCPYCRANRSHHPHE